MRNKLVTTALCIALACTLLTGCQSTSTAETEAGAAQDNSADDSIMGQVTALDGNTITLAIGEGDENRRPGQDRASSPDGEADTLPDGGTPPAGKGKGAPPDDSDKDGSSVPENNDRSFEGSSGSVSNSDSSFEGNSTDTDSSGTAADKDSTPSDDAGGAEGQDDMAPPDGNGLPGGLTLTGEEMTITVEESTKIQIDNMGEKKAGSISDILEGSILTLEMDGETVTSITVINMGNGPEREKESGTPTPA